MSIVAPPRPSTKVSKSELERILKLQPYVAHREIRRTRPKDFIHDPHPH